MKEVLRFVFLCTFALEDVAIAKERTSEQRKETIRISVDDSYDPKPTSHPTFSVYSTLRLSHLTHTWRPTYSAGTS